MIDSPSPVLSPEQHAQLMTAMRDKPALSARENINASLPYLSRSWAEFLAQPGWDEFMKGGQRAERWLAEHGQDLED